MTKLTEAQADLRANWMAFCDADPFDDSNTFPDRMEAAGLIELVSVMLIRLTHTTAEGY